MIGLSLGLSILKVRRKIHQSISILKSFNNVITILIIFLESLSNYFLRLEKKVHTAGFRVINFGKRHSIPYLEWDQLALSV